MKVPGKMSVTQTSCRTVFGLHLRGAGASPEKNRHPLGGRYETTFRAGELPKQAPVVTLKTNDLAAAAPTSFALRVCKFLQRCDTKRPSAWQTGLYN
jgi:hypothetical protein